MAIDGKIRDEKLQYDANKEASKYPHYYQVKTGLKVLMILTIHLIY